MFTNITSRLLTSQATMGKELLCFAVLVLCVAYSKSQPNDCPAIPCLLIEYPPSCRTTTFFINNGQACPGCDACIEQSTHLDENGCPLRACTMEMIPDECRRDRYFVYNGRKICRDCSQNTCTM